MNESAVSFHTPETEQQQWLKKGTPGPIEAKVHASRIKQMVLRLPQQQGPHLHELSDQGGQGQHQLHRGGPGQVHEDFPAEEACDVPAGVVFHQGQSSGPHCSYGAGGDHCQWHPDDWAPALFTGSVTHRLLLIPNGKQGTGRPLTRTGDLQE